MYKSIQVLNYFFLSVTFKKYWYSEDISIKKVAKFKQKENENDFQKHIYDPAKYLW